MPRLARRLLLGGLLLLAAVVAVLVVPVLTRAAPAPKPVKAVAETVDLGSVSSPAPGVTVQPAVPPVSGSAAPPSRTSSASPVLTVTRTGLKPFSLVGVSWAYNSAVTGTDVQIRVMKDGGGWGSWTPVGLDSSDQGAEAHHGTATLRGGTAPLWTGPSTGVQVELTTRSGAQPTDVRLDLVDPGTSPADASLGAPAAKAEAHAATTMPPVYSRAQWGADESVRSWDPQYAATISAATLHHTADTNDYTADQVPAIIRAIYQYHAVTLGWGDIGYNVLVDKFGRLWEGRYGGLGSTVIGAHAGGFNTGTFGVSMMGNYDLVDTPQVMVDAVARIIAWKFLLYSVDPNGSTVLTARNGAGTTAKYADGTQVPLPTIFGHRDVGNTVCPGRYGYARLPQIRQEVTALMAGGRTPIQDQYLADPQLQALLGAPIGLEQAAAGVTWQVYANGRLYWSSATGVHVVRAGVLDRYLQAGGPASLGAPTADEQALPDGRGVDAEFQRGSVYWSSTTGAHVVRGAIRGRWLLAGGASGVLGYPVQDEIAAADGVGAFGDFENGRISWSPATGAVVLHGGIRAAYGAAGGEVGPLGYPTQDEADLPAGAGRFQQFQRGVITWTPTGSTRSVLGAVYRMWSGAGGASGALGLPVADERDAGGGGRVQAFENGSVYWSPATGAHAVHGSVLTSWTAAGGVGGVLGYPVTEEGVTPDGGGTTQRFQGGSVYSSAATGTHVTRGGIGAAWLATGGPGGPLGYPTAEETDTPDHSGRMQVFEHGTVYWSAATGAHSVSGDIATEYAAVGGTGGELGLPVVEPAATPDGHGRFQRFQGGSVYSSPTTGAHVVRGGIFAVWSGAGGTSGRLGYPLGDEGPSGVGAVQQFQGGSVTWVAATATPVVSYS